MKTVQITGTTLTPSSLCFGTGQFGSTIERPAAYAQLDTYYAAGGNCIDTAKVYGDWVPGEHSPSEKIIGEWLQMRKSRQDVILATKGAHFDLDAPHVRRVKPADILSDLNASLQHLQTDFIDLYWLHRDDPNQPVAGIIECLESQVKAGKIRYYGASNWRCDRLSEAQEFARANGMQGFCAVQNCWSLAKVNLDGLYDPTMAVMDDDLWQYHYSHQLAGIPHTAQAHGVFHKLAAGKRDAIAPIFQNLFLNSETERRLTKIQALSEQSGMTITQIILGYLLSQPFPTIPVFSSHSQEQMKETLTAADIWLTPDQTSFLVG